MARSHFRSQPSLQRTGQRAGSGWLWLVLLAVVGVAAGVYSAGPRQAWLPDRTETTREEAAAPTVAEVAPPPAATGRETSASTVSPRLPAASETAVAVARITPPEPAPAAPRPLTPMERYTRGADPHEEDLRAYDAAERQAGFGWASDNRIGARSQCEAVRRLRTAPFALGCLDYIGERGGG